MNELMFRHNNETQYLTYKFHLRGSASCCRCQPSAVLRTKAGKVVGENQWPRDS
jgi:hypothetical protein